MPRYLLEVCYKGTKFRGSQVQANAQTVQGELEAALATFLRKEVELTGSSRTDAGVHAKQNFFHFDADAPIDAGITYNLNAMLHQDIAINAITEVPGQFHCRFSALSRSYEYEVYHKKNPFLSDTAWYYPYKMNFHNLQQAAEVTMGFNNFSAFSKRNTDVKTFDCTIMQSRWLQTEQGIKYCVQSNRFLRGMVRALVATMLKVGRGTITLDDYKNIIRQRDCTLADFSAPAHGLCLMKVDYGDALT